jgi:hypothetical protein
MGTEAHWMRDNNLRDVLIHLYEWHNLLLNWVDSNMNGNPKPFLLEPYTWKNYAKMNVKFWEKHQSCAYEKAKEMLDISHKKAIELMKKFNDEELFIKKYFNWTGSSSLGQYMISATSSHYEWALKKVKAHVKEWNK